MRGRFDYRGFVRYDNGELTEPAGYHSDYLAAESAGFIAEAASDRRPFFLCASYSAPYGSCRGDATGTCTAPPIPASRHRRLYDGVRAPFLRSPAFNEADVSDKPRQVTSGGKVSRHAVQRLFRQRIRTLARDPRYRVIERILASRTTRLVRCEGEACRHRFRRFPQPLPYGERP